jgi:hypothetical protein
MGTSLAELVIGVVELLEAEGARVRQRVTGLAASIGLALGAGLLMLVGAGWLAWAGFTALAAALAPAAAAALIGVACLVVAGGVLWNVTRRA